MHTDIHTGGEKAAREKLNLFSLYTDFPASVSSRWAGTRIGLIAGQSWHLWTDIWKLDTLLASDSMKKMATDTAARADILIIAIGSLEQRDLNPIQWLDTVAAAKANPDTPKLVIGLLGTEDAKAPELDWNVKQLMRCSREIGGHFIWHWMGKDAMLDADFLAESVNQLLAAKRAVPAAASQPA
jgi:hypothetical protein